MTDLFRDLSSISWWTSVVVAGLLVNLTAAYIKPWLDRVGGRLSSARQRRLEAALEGRRRMVEHLRTHPHQQIMKTFDEMRSRIRSSEILGVALLAWGLGGAIKIAMIVKPFGLEAPEGSLEYYALDLSANACMGLAAVGYVLGLRVRLDAMRLRSLIRDASDEAGEPAPDSAAAEPPAGL